MTTKPQHCRSGDVKDHSDEREHQDEQVTYTYADAGQLLVRVFEAFGLMLLPHECTNDAQARDLLAQDAVDRIDALLHLTEERHKEEHEDTHDDE